MNELRRLGGSKAMHIFALARLCPAAAAGTGAGLSVAAHHDRRRSPVNAVDVK